MRRTRSVTALVVAVFFAGAPAAIAAEGDDVDLVAFGESLESLRQALGIPGMAAAVVDGQEIVFAEGFGYADVENQIEATSSTPFGLASVTKPIAATLIMQLVEAGLIDLDTPIADYGVSIAGDRGITVRHLLTHTSAGTPGLVHEYNGDRYGFLGGVIEGATGESFAALLSERILLPVGMSDSALNPIEQWGGLGSSVADFARALGWGENYRQYPDVYRRLTRPYQFGANDEIVPGMYHLHHNPAAGMVASAEDLARFDIALDGGEILQPETMAQMWSPAIATVAGRSDLNYGLGWYVQDFGGTRMVWHTGRWPPSTSALYLKVPEFDLTFIIVGNTDSLTAPFPNIGSGDLARSAPMLTFFHRFVFPRLTGHDLPVIDWSAGQAEVLAALAPIDDEIDRRMLERELWSYRQAFASSRQSQQAEVLGRVARSAFPRSEFARDASYTSTAGPMPVMEPIMSAAAFASVAVAVLVWLIVAAAGVVWMVVRLVRSQTARLWDWIVWLVATALVGPLAPVIHRQVVRGRCQTVCASLLPISGYAIAWAVAVLTIMRVGGEPHPAVILGATVVLPAVTGLALVRAPMLRRVGVGSYLAGLRRGTLVEVITWSVAFAAFLPVTFLIDGFLLSTVPPPSSPFFGAMMSAVALVALAVLMGLNRLLERRGFSTWPASATVTGLVGTLELPRFRNTWWLLLTGIALIATALAVTIALVG